MVNMCQACALELTQLNVPREVSLAAQCVGDLSNHDASEQQKWLVRGLQNLSSFYTQKSGPSTTKRPFLYCHNPGAGRLIELC